MAKGLNLIRKDERLSYRHESGAVFHYKRLACFERDDLISALSQDERSGQVKDEVHFIDFIILRGLLEWEKVYENEGDTDIAPITIENVHELVAGVKDDLYARIWGGRPENPFLNLKSISESKNPTSGDSAKNATETTEQKSQNGSLPA